MGNLFSLHIFNKKRPKIKISLKLFQSSAENYTTSVNVYEHIHYQSSCQFYGRPIFERNTLQLCMYHTKTQCESVKATSLQM